MSHAATRRPLVVVALMLSTFLAALEMTVVSTAMPTVTAELGGLSMYAWVFSAYMLLSTVTVPIYGKLADLVGRKPVMLFGLGVFLAGSLGSGSAPTMGWLIAFRALQGLGAGAIQPVSLTILGDLFTLEERARMQGVFGAVWGVAGLLGPAVGGLIVEWLSWRWIFWINLPFGLASMVMLSLVLHERAPAKRHRLDWAGALLLSAAIVGLLLGTHGGAGQLALAMGGAGLLMAAFVWVERRAPEPLVPLDLFNDRTIAVASAAGALVGAGMFATVTYVPLYVQGVLGGSPTEAASALTPMVVGWPVASAIAGRILGRVGARALVRWGLGLTAVSGLALALGMQPGVNLWVPRVVCAAFGAGLGLANTALLIAIQASVDWSRRGVATASALFFRTIGGTLSVGVLGAVLVASLTRDPSVPAGAADALLGPDHGAHLDPAIIDTLRGALTDSLGIAFWAVAAITACAFLVALAFPRIEAGQATRTVGEAAPE